MPELRNKDWEDLHRLWWVCVKERNRIATYEAERKRLRAGYGEFEADGRLGEVSIHALRAAIFDGCIDAKKHC